MDFGSRNGKIKSLEEIYLFSFAIKEAAVIDFFLESAPKNERLKILSVQKHTTKLAKELVSRHLFVVGNFNGRVDLVVNCLELASVFRGAISVAKLSIISICRDIGDLNGKPNPVPCKVRGCCGSVCVQLILATRATRIVSDPVPEKLLSMVGLKDCYTSTIGNFAKSGLQRHLQNLRKSDL